MTKTDLSTALRNAISSVLETMFFSSLEFPDEPRAEEWREFHSRQMITCRLDFKGPLSGSVMVFTPARTLTALTADFMGLEKVEVTGEQERGALTELTNMITGDLFSRYEPEAVYALGIPRIVPFGEELLQPETTGTQSCFVRTMDGPVGVRIITN